METETTFKSGSKTYNLKLVVTELSESTNNVLNTSKNIFSILSNIINSKKSPGNEEQLKKSLDEIVEYIKNDNKTQFDKVFESLNGLLGNTNKKPENTPFYDRVKEVINDHNIKELLNGLGLDKVKIDEVMKTSNNIIDTLKKSNSSATLPEGLLNCIKRGEGMRKSNLNENNEIRKENAKEAVDSIFSGVKIYPLNGETSSEYPRINLRAKLEEELSAIKKNQDEESAKSKMDNLDTIANIFKCAVNVVSKDEKMSKTGNDIIDMYLKFTKEASALKK